MPSLIKTLYSSYNNSKGLPFWNVEDIKKRLYIKDYLTLHLQNILCQLNQAWNFQEIEAPILTPLELINPNYTDNDYFKTNDNKLAIRPETTMGSYEVAKHYLNNGYKLPLAIFQQGKSFRKEDSEQSMQMHKRFTEFYQLEYQCLYSANSKADYYNEVITKLPAIVQDLIKLETRCVPSDRLPAYSKQTMDIEVRTHPEKWLEICSISDRIDYAENIKNVEVAFGLDRLLLCL